MFCIFNDMSESCVFGKDRYIYAYVEIIAPFLINVGGRNLRTDGAGIGARDACTMRI